MERDDRASVAGFYAGNHALVAGATTTLGEEAAHHARVRRLAEHDAVMLTDGAGRRAEGRIERITKATLQIAIESIGFVARPPDVHLLVPIADRDHMLWCAEKCTELGATSWCPVMWHRSRSVSPRGEGAAFQARIRGRMQSALVQSHSAWLPDVIEDASPEDAIGRLPNVGTRIVLDGGGEPIARLTPTPPVAIAIGPEGGLERTELAMLREARFRPVSLGANVLRFETAAIAALAIVRAALDHSTEIANG